MGQSKKGGFILQAGILAAAGIIVRIIGNLYDYSFDFNKWNSISSFQNSSWFDGKETIPQRA